MKTPASTKTAKPVALLFRTLAIGSLVVLLQGVSFAESAKTLTSIAECLAEVRTRTNQPRAAVNLTATVTLVDEKRGLIVLQDDSSAMAVQTPLPGLALKPGQRVNISGDAIAPYTRAFPAYPDQPSSQNVLGTFEIPTNGATFFLTRIRGYLHPPVSGQYTFWLTADDAGELSLSPDTSPERMQAIAMNKTGSATRSRDWNRYPSQRSKPIMLNAGKAYYVEATHIQSYGRENFAVAWEGPGIQRSVIEGRHLTPWIGTAASSTPPSAAPTNGLLHESWNNFFVRGYDSFHAQNPFESIVRIGSLKLTPAGASELPPPQWIDTDTRLDAVPNLRWVELEGEVSFAMGDAGTLRFELKRNDSGLSVQVLRWNGQPKERMLHSHIRIRGVLEHAYGSGGEVVDTVLWTPDDQQVGMLQAPASQTDLVSQIAICDLNPADPEMRWGRRVSVRGRIIQQNPNGKTLLQSSDNYTAFGSKDGKDWLPLGKAVEIGMSNSAHVGLVVLSRHPAAPTHTSFSNLSGVATNWFGTGIGNPAYLGSFNLRDGTVSMAGGGRKIGERGDQFYYLHQPAAGEMEVSVQLLDLAVTNTASGPSTPQAGLMIREALNSRSTFAMVLFTPNIGPAFQYRRYPGEPIIGFEPKRKYADFRWFKLVRQKSLLQFQGAPLAEIDTNQLMNVTGVITWQDRTPILTEAFVETAPDENRRSQPPLSETLQSISSFVTRALHPPEPYLQGRMDSPLLRGVVTFCGEVLGTNTMFIQSETESGIRIGWDGVNAYPKFEVGQLVEILGFTPVRRFPVILQPYDLKSAGWGTLPKPEHYSLELTKGENAQARWVEATGVVRSEDTNGVLTLMTKHGPLAVWVGDSQRTVTSKYIDAALRVRGVLSLDATRTVHLLVPSPKFVEVQELAATDPFALPYFSISNLTTLKEKPERLRRMKLSGTVTCRLPQGAFVQDETGGTFVRCGETNEIQTGDLIEAVGFPENDSGTLVLTEAMIRKIGPGRLPPTQEVSLTKNYEEREFANTLITVDGTLLEQRDTQHGQLLTLQAGTKIFEAALLRNANERLPQITAGSRVSIRGVLQLDPGASRFEQFGASAISSTVPFLVWLRSPTDAVVLERPPWWTLQRVAIVGGLLAFGLFGALIRVRTLRRRVAQRTLELQATMGKLEKETRTSAVLGERDRLAGEIHDSLQQGLAAIILQLDVANKHAEASPDAQRLLRMARGMAEFSRAEVEHAVWDLQSPLLDNADLGTALTHVASLIGTGTPQVTVEILGARRPLPSAVEHHLLRIGQEAITNAIKHAQARNVRLTLNYSGREVLLSAHDDGIGFVPETVLTGNGTGHFGLHGIRSRARKIDAKLSISSQPGKGTNITVTLPLLSENSSVPIDDKKSSP